MVIEPQRQRIVRLTALRDVLAIIHDGIVAVPPRASTLAAARGRALAQDVVASVRPVAAIALRDGWAVDASALADAGPYSPVTFGTLPPEVDVGEPMPSGTDAVASFEAVAPRGAGAEVVAPVARGEGVLPVGADATGGQPLRRMGERVRNIDAAVFAAAGMTEVMLRVPRVRLACGSETRSALVDSAIAALARAVEAAGGDVRDAGQVSPPEQALNDTSSDAVIVVGGTGSGRNDRSLQVLARLGRVAMHGIAIAPGETAAFGFIGRRPILLVPGRIDAALAVWLLLGRPLLARLTGMTDEDVGTMLPLTRKITSNLGLAEVVAVRRRDDGVEPLASGYLPLAALAQSDGWIVIPPDSEGYPPGTSVLVRPWP